MSGKTAAIIGATGMIGNYLLELLLQDDYFDTVRVIVRRPFEKKDPKIEVKLVDFNDAESLKLALEATDVVFCAIGTTRKNVKGDKEQYRKIDYDIPVKSARFAKEAGCQVFTIVSSVGADSESNTFYLKLKGEVEDALEIIAFPSLHMFQPSLLLGDRKEFRLSERLITAPYRLISALFMGSIRKFKPIHGRELAIAMIKVSKNAKPGTHRYIYDEIKALAR